MQIFLFLLGLLLSREAIAAPAAPVKALVLEHRALLWYIHLQLGRVSSKSDHPLDLLFFNLTSHTQDYLYILTVASLYYYELLAQFWDLGKYYYR
ncbi:hypothetical protein PGT21_004219 [Puccinia graminis f. sp. tritici]|uniref:Uncharacterized protein n=1 Tax=Puccinia graminis f. sp. tritici TaxID=56615 RepID=A0A5B0PIZ4_PUCGR|nr:hypothetical protein PGT21_004219 [Puccinia graminis f. sp. tritici]